MMRQPAGDFKLIDSLNSRNTRMGTMLELKFHSIRLLDVIFSAVSVENFPTAPVVRTSGAFGLSGCATAWGQLKKSSVKYAILDGEYMGRIVNSPVFYQ